MSTATNKKERSQLQAIHKAGQQHKEMVAGLNSAIMGFVQPQAIPLEEAVIGACLMESKAFDTVKFLRPEDMYDDAHALLWASFEVMEERGIPIDLLTVTEHLKNLNKWSVGGKLNPILTPVTAERLTVNNALDAIGGPYALVELTQRVGSSANIEYHARIIKQRSLQREGIRILARGITQCFEDPDGIYDVRNEIAEQLLVNSPTSYFRVRTMDQVLDDAANLPTMAQLAGPLLQINGITIVFAGPGVGKSIFAFQLGTDIAEGRSVFPGVLNNAHGQPMKTLFLDMELFDKELEDRYTDQYDHKRRAVFSKNFMRVDPNPEFLEYPDEEMDKYLKNQIEQIVRTHTPDLLIVDNLTALSSESASDPNIAIKVMKFLKKLRTKYKLTILVLAHTTKQSNKQESLELYRMKGASAIQDFAPTIFGIGENFNQPGGYYMKQLKGRNSERSFGKENVIKVLIDKPDGIMLKYVFDGLDHEDNCLSAFLDHNDQDDMIEKALKIKAKEPNKGWRALKDEVGYPFSHVTLMNKAKEFAAGSTIYEFDARGNVIAKEEEPAAPSSPNLPADVKGDPKEDLPF